jgi:hypothetical protein
MRTPFCCHAIGCPPIHCTNKRQAALSLPSGTDIPKFLRLRSVSLIYSPNRAGRDLINMYFNNLMVFTSKKMINNALKKNFNNIFNKLSYFLQFCILYFQDGPLLVFTGEKSRSAENPLLQVGSFHI